MAKVCQLFSGSSGNSILVSSSGHNYLVDIGVSAKKCENGLNQIGIEPGSIEGIFVTHIELDGIDAKAFHQSHDRIDCLGYRFNFSDGRSAAVCTDTGFITDNAKEILPGTDLIFIESNHEIAMVNAGTYPYILKQRILGASGHLSNFACSEYIKELAKSGTTRFVLAHLSRENNLPELARQTAVAALSEIDMEENKDYRLYVSPPENNSRSIIL